MKINEFVEAEFDPEYNPEFDRHGKELDTDDGDDLTNIKPQTKIKIMKDMQTSKGLDTMLAFVHKNKYVK